MANKKIERAGRAEEIQGNNDKERLLFIGRNYDAIRDIPSSQIATVSEDGETVITIQGTKVSDRLVEEALREDDARKAAARAVKGVPVDAVSKEQVQVMIEEAVSRAMAGSSQEPPK
jgi:site-specific recombinase XerC